MEPKPLGLPGSATAYIKYNHNYTRIRICMDAWGFARICSDSHGFIRIPEESHGFIEICEDS